MKLSRAIGILAVALAGLIILLAPLLGLCPKLRALLHPGCVLGLTMIQALRSGILILIAPPTSGPSA